MQVVQGVAVLAEDDDFAEPPARVVHVGVVLEDRESSSHLRSLPRRRRAWPAVRAVRMTISAPVRRWFWRRWPGRRAFLSPGLSCSSAFRSSSSSADIGERLGEDLLAADAAFLLAQPAFEAFAAALEGLENGLGAGGEAALEGGERKSDRAFALAAELVGLAHFRFARSA